MGATIEGCRNLGGPADAVAAIMDKARTLEIGRACGLDVPLSWQPCSRRIGCRRSAGRWC
jgi:hypothetical protein